MNHFASSSVCSPNNNEYRGSNDNKPRGKSVRELRKESPDSDTGETSVDDVELFMGPMSQQKKYQGMVCCY